jgi:glycosyltransferase involved in cell wall biosynthesis
MAAPPLFTVVIPTFGRPRFLADAVASVLAQTEGDLECVVVDDASPEPVVSPIDDGRVRVVRLGANGGPAAARNAGVAEARGRHLAFLDDDDWWEPDRLAQARVGHDRAPVVVGWSRYDDEPIATGRTLEGDVADVILDDITPHLGATTVARDAWLPLDEGYLGAEDNEWWLRTAEHHAVATVATGSHVIRRHDEDRGRHGAEARVSGGLRLLDEHADYFAEHPRAAAFRWKRVGLQALAAGDRSQARKAFLRSARLRPDPALAKHYMNTLTRPQRQRRP